MLIMLAVFACLAGIFALLVIAELMGKHHILKGEYHRKFLHISAGTFIAFWPWLISWKAIQTIGILMLLVMIANRYISLFNYHGWIGRATYGDIFLALAILTCSYITHDKIFFALAILEVAIADGLAAVAGIAYGKGWEYKVFGYKKTVIGTMVFWVVSALILSTGLLAAHNVFSLHAYYFLILLLPPTLTILENLAIYGIDNVVIPIALIVILRLVQT
jgi:dolichol kinase